MVLGTLHRLALKDSLRIMTTSKRSFYNSKAKNDGRYTNRNTFYQGFRAVSIFNKLVAFFWKFF